MCYQNILVGLDDSSCSHAALAGAMRFAKRNNSKLSVIHAVFFDTEEFTFSPAHYQERAEHGRALCNETLKKYTQDMDIECIVRQGEPHEVITTVANEKGADLIVLGTYGRKGLRRLVMGSVTAGVILDACCDVLVVKDQFEQFNGAFSSFLVPYDGSELSKQALDRAIALKKLSDSLNRQKPEAQPEDDAEKGKKADITLLYVTPQYEEMLEFFKTNGIREKIQDEARRIVLSGIKRAVTSGVSVNTILKDGTPPVVIASVAKEIGCDMIVMGSHGWRGINKAMLGSTAERVLTYSEVPVLVAKGGQS